MTEQLPVEMPAKHALWEDAIALPIGAFLISWGMFVLHEIGAVTGGLAGVAFVTSYATGWTLGLVYFVVNIPFYVLAWKRVGRAFTIKTLIAVALISVGTALHEHFIDVTRIGPMYAAIFAGLCIGNGMLVLFRHGASGGGFGILGAYLQDRFGIRIGVTQGVLDVTVVLASLAFVSPWLLLCSVVGVVVLNLVLAINHRPGRYFG